MGKASQRKIDLVFKRKRDDDMIGVEEDPSPMADQPLPMLEIEQPHPESQDEGLHVNEHVIFQGVEFLQRDPGLRPQVWQYPPEQRDSVWRAYLNRRLIIKMHENLQEHQMARTLLVNYHKEMDPGNGFLAAKLTDDLVVEILSRLPFKSFCRFKCVCKAWLALSSDPQYCKKLLKIPTGLLYQRRYNSAIKLASLPHNDKDFDEALSFLPQYEQLELMDSCNGLVLCKYKSSCTPFGICRFIVCNPATREWKVLPDTPPSDYNPFYNLSILAFSPSWSTKFYIFNFQRLSTLRLGFGPVKLQVLSSDLSTWFLDDTSWLSETMASQPHLFIDGALYVRTGLHEILVLKGLEETSSGILPSLRTIELPHEDVGFMARFSQRCFGQSSGALHYALPEEDARTILVWSLDVDEPYEWSLKYRLSMSHAFGRDNLCQYDAHSWKCDYEVIALDLESDDLLLFDKQADKLRLYNIRTGELNVIQPDDHRCRMLQDNCYHYVAFYSKLPALTM